MLTIILIMLAGIITGYLLRNKNKLLKTVNKSTLYIIFMLLFFMGISVGSNNTIMRNLDTIGFRGLQLALFTILGSVLLSWLVYIVVFKTKTK